MSTYILVEGRRTEKKIYPFWLEHIIPEYSMKESVDVEDENSYYIVSGFGYPRIKKRITDSLRDIESFPHYQNFIVILDSDEQDLKELKSDIEGLIQLEKKKLNIFDLKIFVLIQKRAIETWLLGNRNVFQENPQNEELRDYVQYYNVRDNDPELMGNYSERFTHARFHLRYLKLLLREKNIKYTKNFPRDTKEIYYLKEIISRVNDKPDHLKSFQTMLDCFRSIN